MRLFCCGLVAWTILGACSWLSAAPPRRVATLTLRDFETLDYPAIRRKAVAEFGEKRVREIEALSTREAARSLAGGSAYQDALQRVRASREPEPVRLALPPASPRVVFDEAPPTSGTLFVIEGPGVDQVFGTGSYRPLTGTVVHAGRRRR